MRYAKLKNSNRLKRVLRLLRKGSKTTRQIIREARVCAVNSIISEIRRNGYDIECSYVRAGVYKYTLKRRLGHYVPGRI